MKMTAPFHFKTVLFDVDGTLIDSNGAHADAWTQALAEHDVAIDVASIRPLIGMGGDKLLPMVAHVEAESRPGRAIALRKKKIFAERLASLQATRGARPLVEFLRQRGDDLVIATSADDQEVSALLDRAGVADLFPIRASKDDAADSKPDPDIVQAALARVSGRPDLTVMIGDTPYDVEAASRAGVRTIALRCGGHWTDKDLHGAIAIFDDPAELLRRLQEPSG